MAVDVLVETGKDQAGGGPGAPRTRDRLNTNGKIVTTSTRDTVPRPPAREGSTRLACVVRMSLERLTMYFKPAFVQRDATRSVVDGARTSSFAKHSTKQNNRRPGELSHLLLSPCHAVLPCTLQRQHVLFCGTTM